MIETTVRDAELREMLNERRRQMQNDVQSRLRKALSGRPHEVRDDLEHADADIQGDIEFSLLQTKTEALARIDEALVRLDTGKYGFCFGCEREISERRLHAMPFAVRCQACEERREQEQGHAQRLAQRRSNLTFLPDAIGS